MVKNVDTYSTGIMYVHIVLRKLLYMTIFFLLIQCLLSLFLDNTNLITYFMLCRCIHNGKLLQSPAMAKSFSKIERDYCDNHNMQALWSRTKSKYREKIVPNIPRDICKDINEKIAVRSFCFILNSI